MAGYLEALEQFSAAEHLQSRLERSHALPSQVTGWMLAAQARAGMPGQARALLATLDDERANSGEIHNACAVTCLAEGDRPEPSARCSMFSVARHRSSAASRSWRRTC